MTYGTVTDTQYIIRFERGDDLIPTLVQFCKTNHITNASLSAIGSIENPTLAHYRLDTKKYSEKTFEGIYEVVSLLGNIALHEGEPLVHCHVTISDEEMHVFAGHLVQGTVSATLEMILQQFPTSFEKQYSEEIGLKLWKLPEQ